MNGFRRAHHLGALAWQSNLSDKAKLWAAWMAGGNCGRSSNGSPTICHSNLTSGITVRWSLLEENVGAASPSSNLAGLQNGLQQSPHHAENMLNSRITSIGVGVAYSGNTVYVAQEFMAP
ncbi:MAG TPA: CAP domain-containing protein [Acidimicrobiia bacterium]|nr:CAP domain-containing protein [Acidimicrobiia bacterium]